MVTGISAPYEGQRSLSNPGSPGLVMKRGGNGDGEDDRDGVVAVVVDGDGDTAVKGVS